MVQLQVINKILQDRDASILLMNNLTAEYFSDYPEEFSYIQEHVKKYGNVPDKETFISKFNDFDFIQVNEPISYLLSELQEDKNRRFLASTFNRIRSLIEEDKIEQAMTLYSTSSLEASKSVDMECFDLIHDKSRYDKYIERCTNLDKYYVTTGFKELDEIIGGWDRKEELATLVARPNVGKSWMLLKCAVAAAQKGLRVGIYSGEMSEVKVGYRMDTLISHISNRGIVGGNSELQVEYKKYLDGLDKEIPGSILVLTPASINGLAGVNALRAFINKEKLDMLCVDQHSLLEDDRGAKNPVDKAANISKDLKNLQVLSGIPIIAVSQQNRESTENGVSTANIAQSDRIGQDSTVVVFFERDNQNDGVINLKLEKSRDSINNKTLKYIVDFDKGIFKYLPVQDEKSSSELKKEYDGDEEPF